jgi:antitoxin (DNA-binding transcriptional repressor) of toxin-antitoxin stability system
MTTTDTDTDRRGPLDIGDNDGFTAAICELLAYREPIEVTDHGETVALIVPAPAPVVPVPGKGTRLVFTLVTPLDRAGALDRRDDILAHLAMIGIRASVIDGGDVIRLADAGVPTLGDLAAGAAAGTDG